jgi:hypothetical protein
MGSARVTTDHDEIRRWTEERGGKPATVVGTGDEKDPGILRIDFPEYSGEGALREISWDELFKKLDEKGLAFLYQETTADGKLSRFNKFVSHETAEAQLGEAAQGAEPKEAPAAQHAPRRARARTSTRRAKTGGEKGARGRSRSRTKAPAARRRSSATRVRTRSASKSRAKPKRRPRR